MPTLLDRLHDEIDEQEELAEEARGIVDEAKQHLLDLVDDTGDTQTALEAVAVLVEQRLAQRVVKKAVRKGYEASRRRARLLEDDEARNEAEGDGV